MNSRKRSKKLSYVWLIAVIIPAIVVSATLQKPEDTNRSTLYDELQVGCIYESPKRVMVMSMLQPEGLEATLKDFEDCMSAPEGIIFAVLDRASKNDIIWYSVRVIGGPNDGWQNIDGENINQSIIQNLFENSNGIDGWIISLAFYPSNVIEIQTSQIRKHSNDDDNEELPKTNLKKELQWLQSSQVLLKLGFTEWRHIDLADGTERWLADASNLTCELTPNYIGILEKTTIAKMGAKCTQAIREINRFMCPDDYEIVNTTILDSLLQLSASHLDQEQVIVYGKFNIELSNKPTFELIYYEISKR
jgi:hypothetical protein